MKTTITTIAALAAGIGLAAAGATSRATLVAASDLKWTEAPNTGGVKVAPLVGDMTKGPHQMMVTFPAGQKHPLHTHTKTLKLVTITGQFIYGPEGGPEQTYGPGSYIMIPGGLRHTSGCTDAGPCILYHAATGKFDNKPAAEKKTQP